MNLNNNTITRIFKKSKADLPVFNFSGSEDLVFPFEVKTGFINTTEEGIVFNSNVTDYARFERIFTGFEAISAIWQNSTSLLVNNDNLNHPVARKNYQPGGALLWHFDSDNFSETFSSLAENSDYQKEMVVSTASFYSRTQVTQDDVLKLYAIPKKYGKVLMYIENVESFYEPSTQEFKYAKVSLRSLNDKLADTGLAIDQYIQFSAPGEGYAFPQLIPFITKWDRKAHAYRTYATKEVIPTLTLNALDSGNTFIINNYIDELGIPQGECLVEYSKATGLWSLIKAGRGYILDNKKLQNRPIVSAQFELYAPGMLASLYAYGRPITKKNGQGDEMTVSRYLPIDSINIPDLSQRDVTKPLSQNSSNIWIPVSRTEIESWWKDWSESVQGDKNPGIRKQWEGYLRVKTASLPEHRFWNGLFKFALGPVANLIWGKQLDSQFPTKPITGQPGHDDGYWSIGDGDYALGYLLNRNYFIHQSVNRVPLNYTESIPWTLKNIPLVGGIASKVTLGLPVAWKTQSQTGGQNYNITGMMAKPLFEFHKNTFMGEKSYGNEKYGAVPFDGLKDDAQPAAVSPAEFSTILNFDFTDQYKATDAAPISNTQWLGFIDDTGRRYEWQNDSKAVPKAATTDGYAIDLFGFHVLGSGTWKITFFALDDAGVKTPVYQGTYRTLSKLTNSVRDWSNTVKLSHWTADKSFEYRTEAPEPSTISLPKNVEYALNKVTNAEIKPDYVLNTDGSIARDQFGNAIQKLTADGTPIYKTTEVKDVDYVQPGSVQNFVVVPAISTIDLVEKAVRYNYTSTKPAFAFTGVSNTIDFLEPVYGGSMLKLNEDLFKGKQAIFKQHYDNGFRNGFFTITGSALGSDYTSDPNALSRATLNDINIKVPVTLNADGTIAFKSSRIADTNVISTVAEGQGKFTNIALPYAKYWKQELAAGRLNAPVVTRFTELSLVELATSEFNARESWSGLRVLMSGSGSEAALFVGYATANDTIQANVKQSQETHLKISEMTLSK